MNASGSSRRPAALAAWAPLGWLRTIFRSVAGWHGGESPYPSRSNLLSDHVRKDIGVSCADVWRPCRTPSWLD